MKIAVVGATGLVGTKMLKVLEEQNFPVSELIPVASARSVGKTVTFRGKEYTVVSMDDGVAAKPDIALFSAGGGTSREHAPRFAEVGTIVIDNSSAWRMDPRYPLVVPEINMHAVGDAKIIANPNCSTIQMVMVLAPLHKTYKIKRLVISTYQSVSGTGKKAIDQLNGELKGEDVKKVYPKQIHANCLPHCDIFLDNDYTKEEMKMVNETRKILGDQSIQITATCARVPVVCGHSESVNIEFESEFDVQEVKDILANTSGVILADDIQNLVYPTPLMADDKDEVFVGRIRRDHSIQNGLNLWIVSDNLRKGAATNAVQIAKRLIEKVPV